MKVTERVKIVIVGDGGCGKTTLLYAFQRGRATPQHYYYDGSLELKIGNNRVPLEVYDTAGQEDFAQIRMLVYPGTDGG